MDGGRLKPAATLALPLAIVVVLALVFALTGALTNRSTAARGWRLTQTYDPNEVADIVAPSSRDAWMADLRPGRTVVVHHWDGTRWHIVQAPAAMFSDEGVVVAASSASNAWIFTYTRPAVAAAYSVAWHWDGSGWSRSRLPAGTTILTAMAYGPADVRAFGELDSGRGAVESYAVRYNGKAWQRVAVPVLASSESSLSAEDTWIVGETDASLAASTPSWAMANWTGASWHLLPLPAVRRAKGLAVSRPGILALSPASIWADFQLVRDGSDDGAVFLHYDGHSWAQIPVPHWAATSHSNMTPDGRGGFWIAISTLRSYSEMFDYRNGHWSGPDVLSKAGHYTVINATATRPGSTQAWAVGYRGSTTGAPDTRAVVYEYRT
jgi:hypothetical protein